VGAPASRVAHGRGRPTDGSMSVLTYDSVRSRPSVCSARRKRRDRVTLGSIRQPKKRAEAQLLHAGAVVPTLLTPVGPYGEAVRVAASLVGTAQLHVARVASVRPERHAATGWRVVAGDAHQRSAAA